MGYTKRLSRDEEVISREALKALPEYSVSVPTGKTIGKRWRCMVGDFQNPEWFIREYVEIGSEDSVGIKSVWAVDENHEPHRGKLND